MPPPSSVCFWLEWSMGWSILTWCSRVFIGAVLLASALGKSLDLPGFVGVLTTYQLFPSWLLWPLAVSITGCEWALGAWVLSGWQLQAGAFLAMMLNGLYAGGLTVTLFRGLELPNCGCYGVFFPQPLRWYSPFEDLILVGIGYALYVGAGKRDPGLDKVS